MNLRLTNMLWIVLLLGASVLLYHTSYRVQDLARQLRALDAEQAAEQERIHVLKAEWAYLTRPARLQELAAKYLPLRQIKTAQITRYAMLAAALPERAPEAAPAPVVVAQAAEAPQSRLGKPGIVLTRTAFVGVDGR